MIALTWNLLLALIWTALWGNLSGTNLLIGFIFGYLVLAFGLRDIPEFARYAARAPRLIRFFFYFIGELVKSNLKVAYDVLAPNPRMRPAVIAFPLEAKTDGEITILANLISLTPGTLSLDVSRDRKVLYIHAMYFDGDEPTRQSLREFEQRVLEVMR